MSVSVPNDQLLMLVTNRSASATGDWNSDQAGANWFGSIESQPEFSVVARAINQYHAQNISLLPVVAHAACVSRFRPGVPQELASVAMAGDCPHALHIDKQAYAGISLYNLVGISYIDSITASNGFTVGTVGTNVCPTGSVSVGTEAECTSAATTLGQSWRASISSDSEQKGCFFNDIGFVYFNTHQTGDTHATVTPICKPANSALYGAEQHSVNISLQIGPGFELTLANMPTDVFSTCADTQQGSCRHVTISGTVTQVNAALETAAITLTPLSSEISSSSIRYLSYCVCMCASVYAPHCVRACV